MNKVERNNETTMNKVESNMMQLRSSSADSIVIRGCLGSWPPRYRSFTCILVLVLTLVLVLLLATTIVLEVLVLFPALVTNIVTASGTSSIGFWGALPSYMAQSDIIDITLLKSAKKQWHTFRNYLLSNNLYWFLWGRHPSLKCNNSVM